MRKVFVIAAFAFILSLSGCLVLEHRGPKDDRDKQKNEQQKDQKDKHRDQQKDRQQDQQ